MNVILVTRLQHPYLNTCMCTVDGIVSGSYSLHWHGLVLFGPIVPQIHRTAIVSDKFSSTAPFYVKKFPHNFSGRTLISREY